MILNSLTLYFGIASSSLLILLPLFLSPFSIPLLLHVPSLLSPHPPSSLFPPGFFLSVAPPLLLSPLSSQSWCPQCSLHHPARGQWLYGGWDGAVTTRLTLCGEEGSRVQPGGSRGRGSWDCSLHIPWKLCHIHRTFLLCACCTTPWVLRVLV